MVLLIRFSHFWQHKYRQSWRFLTLVLLIGFLGLSIAVLPANALENGQTLFEQSCAGCHTLDNTGLGFAPGLQGVTQKRDRLWLLHWIAAPEEMLEAGDPQAQEILAQYNGVPMPNMGLTPSQVEAVVAYLEQLDSSGDATPTAEPAEVPVAVPAEATLAGQQLFTGKTSFKNGGPACMSCHTANIGILGGGSLGPNLTHVIDRYGNIGMESVLKTLPYPSMQGIYQNRLLTEDEQKALLAFFQEVNNPATPTAENDQTSLTLTPTLKFVAIAFSGFLLLLLLSQLAWRDRFTGVRQNLVEGK